MKKSKTKSQERIQNELRQKIEKLKFVTVFCTGVSLALIIVLCWTMLVPSLTLQGVISMIVCCIVLLIILYRKTLALSSHAKALEEYAKAEPVTIEHPSFKKKVEQTLQQKNTGPITDPYIQQANFQQPTTTERSYPVIFYFVGENSVSLCLYRLLTYLEYSQMSILVKGGIMSITQMSSLLQNAVGFVNVDDLHIFLNQAGVLDHQYRREIYVYKSPLSVEGKHVSGFVDEQGHIHTRASLLLNKQKMHQFLQEKGFLQA